VAVLRWIVFIHVIINFIIKLYFWKNDKHLINPKICSSSSSKSIRSINSKSSSINLKHLRHLQKSKSSSPRYILNLPNLGLRFQSRHHYQQLLKSMLRTGFQASIPADAIKAVNQMVLFYATTTSLCFPIFLTFCLWSFRLRVLLEHGVESRLEVGWWTYCLGLQWWREGFLSSKCYLKYLCRIQVFCTAFSSTYFFSDAYQKPMFISRKGCLTLQQNHLNFLLDQCPSICASATNDYNGQWWWHPICRSSSIPRDFFFSIALDVVV
jgi:hypothetical protein